MIIFTRAWSVAVATSAGLAAARGGVVSVTETSPAGPVPLFAVCCVGSTGVMVVRVARAWTREPGWCELKVFCGLNCSDCGYIVVVPETADGGDGRRVILDADGGSWAGTGKWL